ncbi:MAG: DUF362 domain-containing protein [Candidatus Stahlbacteria bacterium]|nr:MAG: DUF362 domain-containing protein [Candidatus Stahlbacteria bacterium]
MQQKSLSVVSIVKSKTSIYNEIDFNEMISRSIVNLESKGVKVPSSGNVFIKPNVIMGASAKESITTEPKLIYSLTKHLKKRGVKKVYIGDSPVSYLRAKEAFKATGMDIAIKKSGGEFVNIDDESERTIIKLPNSDMIENISVPKKALEADYIINFAKLKTHRIAAMTCCVKNWVGFIPQDIRLKFHQTRLPKLVSEMHQVLPERLCFADAIIVGEGDGPDLSTPKYLGALLSSNDPVALDSIASELIGINRSDLIFDWTAYFDGIGEIEKSRIKIIGQNSTEGTIHVKKPVSVLYNRFPCNIILGGLCEGCFAWFMGPALFWERDRIWEEINKNVGKPTFMLGFNADDIHYEKHLKEGPYFVVGDCPPNKYRNDPRTIHIKGCCPGPAIPETILKNCKIREGDKWK